MGPEVFISCSSHDKAVGDAACALLERRGLPCWIAPRDIRPGREWGEAIVEGIASCKVFVLVFSASANTSPQIRREIERAVHHGLLIIPFRIEDVPPARSLEYFMSVPHWLDALTPPLERHLERLADVVADYLGREGEGRREPLPLLSPPPRPVPRGSASVWGLAVPGLLALVPAAAGLIGIDPPWPDYFGYLSALIVVAVAGVAYIQPEIVSSRPSRSWATPALIVGGMLVYLALYSLLVEFSPEGREIRGFVCLPDARLVYGDACPALDADALRDAEWNPAKLWTASSLLAARMALVVSWLVMVGGLVLAAATVAAREGLKRAPISGERA